MAEDIEKLVNLQMIGICNVGITGLCFKLSSKESYMFAFENRNSSCGTNTMNAKDKGTPYARPYKLMEYSKRWTGT